MTEGEEMTIGYYTLAGRRKVLVQRNRFILVIVSTIRRQKYK